MQIMIFYDLFLDTKIKSQKYLNPNFLHLGGKLFFHRTFNPKGQVFGITMKKHFFTSKAFQK